MRFTATPHRYVRRSAAQWQAVLEAYERSGRAMIESGV